MKIKFSVFYPNEEGKSFDFEYYLNKHIPFCLELFGDACKGSSVDAGLSGADPAPFTAIGSFLFDSMEDFQGALGPNKQTMGKDVPNFTDIRPQTQVSEVKL